MRDCIAAEKCSCQAPYSESVDMVCRAKRQWLLAPLTLSLALVYFSKYLLYRAIDCSVDSETAGNTYTTQLLISENVGMNRDGVRRVGTVRLYEAANVSPFSATESAFDKGSLQESSGATRNATVTVSTIHGREEATVSPLTSKASNGSTLRPGTEAVPSNNSAFPLIHLPSNTCDISRLKPWNRRVITELHPPVARDCQLLRQGDSKEMDKVSESMKNWTNSESFDDWQLRMSNCSTVLEEFSNNFYISEEELRFPLAFSFVVYDSPQQIIRLLKAIYRPQNIYCIHTDAKQSDNFTKIFRTIGKCLGNVFLASKLESVYYLHNSLLNAQLNCLRDFLALPEERWRYAINLCGKELPLKTNREMVRVLTRLKGTSAVDIVGLAGRNILKNRFRTKVILDVRYGRVHSTNQHLGPPPHGIRIYKSFTFVAASRSFANYILNSQIAIDFLAYLKDIKIAEEHFYASLYHYGNPPGGYKRGVGKVPVVAAIKWMKGPYRNRCHGEVVHEVCVLSSGDLSDIYQLGVNQPRARLFFNKYFMEKDHVAMDCMEEQLLSQNLIEYNSDCQA